MMTGLWESGSWLISMHAVGWCCRVRDDCITVAVEDVPDEGLDQPLRLDKLANEVCACCWHTTAIAY